MSTLKTFDVQLITKGFFSGTVEAASRKDAVERTYHLWRTACPHPFEQDDDELISVIVEEVRS
jgi:hypothetical protein